MSLPIETELAVSVCHEWFDHIAGCRAVSEKMDRVHSLASDGDVEGARALIKEIDDQRDSTPAVFDHERLETAVREIVGYVEERSKMEDLR